MSSNPPPPSRSASVSHPPQMPQMPGSATLPPTPAPPSLQNLNHIVLEYLSKKGYKKTESMLRKESAEPSSSSRTQAVPDQYYRAFTLLRNYVEDSLEIYKPEVSRLLWPVFVHTILDLAEQFFSTDAERVYKEFSSRFKAEHEDELRQLATIRTGDHLSAPIAKLYRDNKYRLTISKLAHNTLMQFLEAQEDEGGATITRLLQSHFNIIPQDRGQLGLDRSLGAMLSRNGEDYDIPFEDEGIPGHNPGSANKDLNAPSALPRVYLGALSQDADAMEDVRAELQEEDLEKPPQPGQTSLVEELEQKIKREPVEDGPSRDLVPLPPPLARDVAMEVQKIRELRDRFKIDPRTGGVPPSVSIVMYTFHNTKDSICCLDFSADLKLVAAGTSQHYIRVWSLDGTPMPSLSADPNAKPVASHRLIGHSAPVYTVSFSSAAAKDPNSDGPSTSPRYLLSCSADKTIRLWSLDAWACLVIYKGHSSPVWDVRWSPHGHYFLTGGGDKTARLWATEHISALRIFVGHDNDVEKVCFHPNGAYAFTAGDRTLRMWDINTGRAVRMFTGHQGNITALECSPNGRLIASADDRGSIILWDLERGLRIKRMNGHGKGGIWSLSWAVESTVLTSAGADMTVRIWDVDWRDDKDKVAVSTGKTGKADAAAAKADGTTGVSGAVAAVNGVASAGTTGAGRTRTRRENVTTLDQISVFPTKQSPVYKVYFSQANLVVAGGAYLPEQAQ